jgi:hypothetical protein
MEAISNLESEGLNAAATSGFSGMVITVSCPVCNAASDDIDHFITHLWDRHLFLAGSGGADHFIAWRSTLINHALKWHHSELRLLLPWTTPKYYEHNSKGVTRVQCPSCSFSAGFEQLYQRRNAVRNAALAHHLSLLRPEAEVVAELYPHRMQILRLYPEFVSHPVFADFDQPQGETPSSSQKQIQSNNTCIMKGVENLEQTMSGFDAPF